MNSSDETLKQSSNDEAVLKAIAELSRNIADLPNRFDNLEIFVTAQFEAVQEGIADNSAKFDRLEAKFYEARFDISNMRADIKDLTQVVRKKEFV